MLSLNAALALNPQALVSQAAKASSIRPVVGFNADFAQYSVSASAPLSKRVPARTPSDQRTAIFFAGDASVSINCEPSSEVPAAGHSHAVSGQSILFSLQAQHVRIQI